MSLHTRIIFIASLLILAIFATVCAAKATVGAIQNVHQHEIMKKNEDVNLIQPWMTIPYIAHVYRVPEQTFYRSLQLQSNLVMQHSTLQVIATYKKQPVEKIIYRVQGTIIAYRKAHPRPTKPSPPATQSLPRGEILAH